MDIFDQEFIEKNGINEEQVKAISEHYSNKLADDKKALEDKYSGEAHKNAQNILSGAAKSITELTGIERNEGEKIAEFIKRSSESFTEKEKTEVSKLKKEYEEKIAKASGADIEKIKQQYAAEKDEILKKYANYDEIQKKAELADTLGEELSGLKLQVAFTNAKPKFPETANEFEVAAKWDLFQKKVLENWKVEIVDGQPVAVDKENPYKQKPIVDLVKEDEALQELLQGRQQKGSGGDPAKDKEVEGVPFPVKENASTRDIRDAIASYLKEKGVKPATDEWSDKMLEYTKKIKEAQQKA